MARPGIPQKIQKKYPAGRIATRTLPVYRATKLPFVRPLRSPKLSVSPCPSFPCCVCFLFLCFFVPCDSSCEEIPENTREEHSMDQYRSRPKFSENFEGHWSIRFPGEIHMDQSLVHTFSWGNSYRPMVLKVLQKFPPTLALVHGWLFPEYPQNQKNTGECLTPLVLTPW